MNQNGTTSDQQDFSNKYPLPINKKAHSENILVPSYFQETVARKNRSDTHKNGQSAFEQVKSRNKQFDDTHSIQNTQNYPINGDISMKNNGTVRKNIAFSIAGAQGYGFKSGSDLINKNKRKSGFFQTLMWRKFAIKWLDITSFTRYKRLEFSHFSLIGDKSIYLEPGFLPNVNSTNNIESIKIGISQIILKFCNTFIQKSKLENNLEGDMQNDTKNNTNENNNAIQISQEQKYKQGVFWQKLMWIDENLKFIPVFSPTGTFKFIWDVIILLVIVSFMFMIPLSITFQKSLEQMFNPFVLRVCNAILISDFFLTWNFGYFEKGLPITLRSQVIINYVTKTLLMDVSACSFLFYDILFTPEESNNRYFLLLFFIKINSIKIIFKKIEERFHLTPKITQISSLLKLLFIIITVAHLFGCIWVKVANTEIESGITSWLQLTKYDSTDWLAQYICAYYFSTVTMITVGYGDFSPVNDQNQMILNIDKFEIQVNNIERLVNIASMLISCGVFAYSINAIGEIFNSLNQKERQIKNDLYAIGNFMSKKNIDLDLQYEVREYLEYQWKSSENRDQEKENSLINQLSNQLKEKLLVETYKVILSQYKIFSENFSEQFMISLIDIIEEVAYRPEELIIFELGEQQCDIFFLERGTVIIYTDEAADKIIKVLKKNDSFGEIGFFTGQGNLINVKAIEHSTLLKIERKKFISLIQTFPTDFEMKVINQKVREEIQLRKLTFRNSKKFPSLILNEYICSIVGNFQMNNQENIYNYLEHFFDNNEESECQQTQFLLENVQTVSHTNINDQINSQQDSYNIENTFYFDDNSPSLLHGRKEGLTGLLDLQQQIQKQNIISIGSKEGGSRSAFNLSLNINQDPDQEQLDSIKKKSSCESPLFQLVPISKNQSIPLPRKDKNSAIQLFACQRPDKSSFLSPQSNLINNISNQNNFGSSFCFDSSKDPLMNNSISNALRPQQTPIQANSQNNEQNKKLQQSTSKKSSMKNKILEEITKLIAQARDQDGQQNKNVIVGEEEFEKQKNFEIYMPHNNLSTVLEYIKFKQKTMKNLKAQQKFISVSRSSAPIIIDQNSKKQYQQLAPLQHCNINYSFFRRFESMKIHGLENKRKQKTAINKKRKSQRVATTNLQKLVLKYEHLQNQPEQHHNSFSDQENHNQNNYHSHFNFERNNTIHCNHEKQLQTSSQFFIPIYQITQRQCSIEAIDALNNNQEHKYSESTYRPSCYRRRMEEYITKKHKFSGKQDIQSLSEMLKDSQTHEKKKTLSNSFSISEIEYERTQNQEDIQCQTSLLSVRKIKNLDHQFKPIKNYKFDESSRRSQSTLYDAPKESNQSLSILNGRKDMKLELFSSNKELFNFQDQPSK